MVFVNYSLIDGNVAMMRIHVIRNGDPPMVVTEEGT